MSVRLLAALGALAACGHRGGSEPAAGSAAPTDVGPPTPAGIDDSWVSKRSDGSVRITGPTFTATFPRMPELAVKVLQAPYAPLGMNDHSMALARREDVYLRFEIIARGPDERPPDPGLIAADWRANGYPKHKEIWFEDGGLKGVMLEASRDGVFQIRSFLDDPVHGLSYEASADGELSVDKAIADDFIHGVHVHPIVEPDPAHAGDAGWAAEPSGAGFRVHERSGAFEITLPSRPTFDRPVRIGSGSDAFPIATATQLASVQGNAGVSVVVFDYTPSAMLHVSQDDRLVSAYTKLAIYTEPQLGFRLPSRVTPAPELTPTPDTVAGHPATRFDGPATPKLHLWYVRVPAHDRIYMIACSEVPCAPVIESIKLAAHPPG